MALNRVSSRRSWWTACAVVAVAGCWVAVTAGQQQPTFRSSVDLIAVDVQVVDNTGRPITALRPEHFEVSIAGRKRRVMTVDFIQSTNIDSPAATLPVTGGPTATNLWPAETAQAAGAGRTFVLAFDTDSFGVSESRDVVAAARGFIRRLRPGDKLGLYTFPVGPRTEPTDDFSVVSRMVDTIVGRSQMMTGEYNLTASEIVDITAEGSRDSSRQLGVARVGGAGGNAPTVNATATSVAEVADSVLQRVQLRECGTISSSCAEMIQIEANAKAFYLEGRATEGLNGLRTLIQLLNEQPGRKTVVMFSAGIPASDRPGGRPEVGELAKQLGQDAAATNTTIYTLHVDTREFQAMRPEQRRNDRSPVSISRDSAVTGRLLEEFSGASGGALIRVLLGGGELALDRVLRETSSHYLLGVEPAEADRDGRLRELRVRVDQRGTTVRSRSWVVVPKRKV
jgi:VWFA-related protein